MKEVLMYTDGACSGNPGPGGYACILQYKGITKILRGGEEETTNNRMELTAVVVGLEALLEPCRVKITSDSKYVVDAIEKGWLDSWKLSGWRKADRKPVLNQELWKRLDDMLRIHEVTFEWIKGHAGHEFNEKCDKIAVEESILRGGMQK